MDLNKGAYLKEPFAYMASYFASGFPLYKVEISFLPSMTSIFLRFISSTTSKYFFIASRVILLLLLPNDINAAFIFYEPVHSKRYDSSVSLAGQQRIGIPMVSRDGNILRFPFLIFFMTSSLTINFYIKTLKDQLSNHFLMCLHQSEHQISYASCQLR